jgi:hypothetical protein
LFCSSQWPCGSRGSLPRRLHWITKCLCASGGIFVLLITMALWESGARYPAGSTGSQRAFAQAEAFSFCSSRWPWPPRTACLLLD